MTLSSRPAMHAQAFSMLSAPPQTEWSRIYGGDSDDFAASVVQTSDGGYVFAGSTESFGAGLNDVWLMKTDATGNVEWNKTYGGAADDVATKAALVQTSDGGYAIAGRTESFGAGYRDFWLVKTDAEGNVEWNQTYGGNANEVAYSLVQTSDGGYAIAGETRSFGAGLYDFWLVKTDATGNVEWNKTYGGAEFNGAYSLVQTSDGGYALCGETWPSGPGYKAFWLVKTDSVGNVEWNQTYGGDGSEVAYSLVQTSDGGYAMAGMTDSFGAGDHDFWLVKTDASGNAQWNQTYGGTYQEIAYFMVQTDDGGFALSGTTQSLSAYWWNDFWLVKTDASGNAQWSYVYGGTTDEAPFAHVQTSDGGYALAGARARVEGDYYDWLLVKVAPLRNVAVTSVSPSKTVAGQGYPVFINVTVQNQGDIAETFNVTAYANDTIIAAFTDIALPSGGSTVLALTWDTLPFARGNYTIKAQATPVPLEADPADNTLADDWLFITIPGDVDGDREVDIFDIVRMAGGYGTKPPNPKYDPNCDIDGDLDIDIFDIVRAAGNYGADW